MRYLILIFFLCNILLAHKLNIFLFEENDKVVVNSYFASGSPCKNCKIEVFNKDGKLIIEDKTDEKGEFYIEKSSENLTVKVEALGGHGAKENIQLENISKEKIVKKDNNLISSIIALFLIGVIFLAIKRFKVGKI